MKNWLPQLSDDGAPRYLALANAIAEDVANGRLKVGQRLPPQRELAKCLSLHFTTVARGYVEARDRGLIDSRVGQGSFVRDQSNSAQRDSRLPARPVDLTMNLPPEPQDRDLVERMQAGAEYVTSDIVALLRYQAFGGADTDKAAAATWLSRRAMSPEHDRLFIAPGAHSALDGILKVIAKPGDTILSEEITYPGIRSIAAQQNLNIRGVPMDQYGILPDAFRDICATRTVRALYLNPTLQNPTTLTMPLERRQSIAEIAQEFDIEILEDDAYGFIPARGQQPAPLAAIVPELTWHIAGLSKCIGAGLRVAYVIVPRSRQAWPFAAAMRASSVMASPLTVALSTRWIEDGTATKLLRAIRAETSERYKLAKKILPSERFQGDPLSFSIWINMPSSWTRTAFVEHMRATGVGVVASDAFAVGNAAPEAVRMCIGGPADRTQIKTALEFAAHALVQTPAMTSTFL